MGSPARDKTLNQMQKERQTELESKMRMDAAAEYVTQQQQRMRQVHNAEI